VFNLRSLLKHDGDSPPRSHVNRSAGQEIKKSFKDSRRTGATPQSGFSHISNTDKRPVAASQTRENLISCAENKPVEQGSILEVKTSAGFSIELQSIDVKKINEASADSAATILQVGSTGAVRHLFIYISLKH